MNKKKTIIAAIVLMLVLLVGGAIAYFTDTENTKNVFTIGKVDVELSEPDWNTEGKTAAETMMPGEEIKKDPTVKLAEDSEDAWVFVKVEVPCLDTTPLFTLGALQSGWTELTTDVTCTSGKATHVYGHTDAMKATDPATSVFKTVTFANLTNTQIESLTDANGDTEEIDLEMPVYAYAIQAEGIENGSTYDVWNTNFNS